MTTTPVMLNEIEVVVLVAIQQILFSACKKIRIRS